MMTDAEKRIKLAEAMGWKCVEHCGTKRWIAPGALGFTGYLDGPNFDPFKDANDDYAVLEWARTNPEGFGVQHNGEWMGWTTFMHMNEQEAHQYKIGNNARTALKVIE